MKERGSLSLLMALGIIPATIFLVIGSLSISRLYYRLEHQQKIIGAAAMFASAACPDKGLAIQKVKKYLELRSNLKIININLDFIDNVIQLSTSGTYKMELINLFGINLDIPFNLQSIAKTVKQNLALAIDTSEYLAPPLFGDVIWNGRDYPAANFISDHYIDLGLNKLAANSQLLTQSCFNPLFEAIKRSALEITAYTRMNSGDSLALAAFPGYQNYFDELYYQGVSNQALKDTLTDEFRSSAICAAAAEREYSNLAYRFPAGSAVFGIDYYIEPQLLSFNSEMHSRMAPEEIIWSLGVKGESYNYNINQLFRFIISSLSGGVNEYSTNKAIILAGDLPRFNGQRYPDAAARQATLDSLRLLSQLGKVSNSLIELHYIFFWDSNQKKFKDSEIEQFQADIYDALSSEDRLRAQLQIINADTDYSKNIYEILFESENSLLVS